MIIDRIRLPLADISVGDKNFDITYMQLTGYIGDPTKEDNNLFYPLFIGEREFKIFVDNSYTVTKIEEV